MALTFKINKMTKNQVNKSYRLISKTIAIFIITAIIWVVAGLMFNL